MRIIRGILLMKLWDGKRIEMKRVKIMGENIMRWEFRDWICIGVKNKKFLLDGILFRELFWRG